MAETQIPDIGKYHIIELVGEGAMGVVYKAKDSVLDRTVAIKVMNDSIARQDDLRKRFLHEAQAAASLQHPNVVCIYDLGDFDGHLFIAMEFVEGIDLEKLLELGQPLSLQAKLDIAIDILTGLSFAHKRGIIHRDIKPANIRVAEDGRAKIMDFGVAHLASSSMTTTGSFLGTPSYMAPEQITEGQTTPGTDIFAVGGVLYQLLTQFKPFEGPTLQNLFFKIITEKPKRVSDLMPGLPPALDRIVEKAMAKEPSERYTNALDMANELSAVRAKLSGPSYPESVSLSASVSSAIEQARRKAQTRSRTFAFAGAGALTAMVLLIGGSQLVKLRSTAGPVAIAPAPTTAGAAAAPNAAAPTTLTGNEVIPSAAALSSPVPPSTRSERSTPSERNSRTAAIAKPTPTKATIARPDPPKRAPATTTQSSVVSAPVNQPPAQNNPVQQPVVTSPPPAPVVVQRVADTPKETAPAPAPKAATPSDIQPLVSAFARAIESGNINNVRAVYPGITGFQQRGFETFFQRARNINVSFRIENFDGTPSSADARLVGSYEFINSDDKPDRRPVTFEVTFQREGNAWRMASMR